MTKFKFWHNQYEKITNPRVIKSDNSCFGTFIRGHKALDKAYIIWDTEDVFIGRDASGDDVKYIEVELCELVNE